MGIIGILAAFALAFELWRLAEALDRARKDMAEANAHLATPKDERN